MQRNYFTVLFFLKKSKLLKNGEAPICMRITINGKRAEVQIKRSIDVTKWNTQKECAIGREKKYQEINHYLDTIRTYYVPYVTLAVMTFPAIVEATQSPVAGAVALVVGILAAWFGASLFQVSVACCAVVFVIELFL